jgi:phosphate transport system ATP-binding protein
VNSEKVIIKDLSFFYDTHQVLDNVNFSVCSNTVTALIGSSGCGKTTCLKCINRMNDLIPGHRVTGEILINEENIYDSSVNISELRRRVGMVFQKPNLFPMSIYDNIAYGLRVHGVKDKETLEEVIVRVLEDVGMWEACKDRLKSKALDLSGGQQQRLCLARALAVSPEILLMDEPTSALDPISTSKIEDLIFRLRDEYTMVIVTHNMQQASRISDMVVFFDSGSVVECSKTYDFFNSPKDERSSRYVMGRII